MTNRNKAVVWVLAVFLLGAFSGGTLVYLLGIPGSNRPSARRPDFRSPEQAFKRLVEDLKLTPDQEPKVKAIFDDGRRDSEQAFKQIGVKTRDRLSTVLTPEQLKKFDQLTEEMRKRWEQRHKQHSD